LNHSLVASCAGLTRASIYFAKSLLKLDGLPGQARQRRQLMVRYERITV